MSPPPPPHYPIQGGMREVTSGRGWRLGALENWAWISLGIAGMADPTQDLSFQPGPLHLHMNVNTAGVCLPNLQVVVQFCLLPKHTRSQLPGFQLGVGGREWKGRSIRYFEMKHPRCEASGQVALHERKVAVLFI